LEQAWSGLPQNARNWHGASKDEALLRSLEERLDPAHTAYVLIDVQNDFCNAGRELNNSFSIIDAALPNMAALLASARSVGSTVIHIQVENGPFFRGPVRLFLAKSSYASIASALSSTPVSMSS
jgi:hypothetical protein